MATGSGLRGPLRYFSTGAVPSPLASPSVVGTPQPFLSGAPMEAVDQLPVLSTVMPDETPRYFGRSWHVLNYPGPYAAASPASNEGLSVTSPGGGTTTLADQATLGGKLRLSTGGADNNSGAIADDAACYAVVAGKRIWFAVRMALPAVTTGEVLVGLSAATLAADLATPPTDGIFFLKADAASDFTFTVRAASTSTSITTVFAKAGVTVPSNNTIFELGFQLDASVTPTTSGLGPVSCYVNGRLAGAIASTDANLVALGVTPTLLKSALQKQTAGAVAGTMDLFQCLCMEEI
jgi:hypothetical protein